MEFVKTRVAVSGDVDCGHTWMNARHYLVETLQLYFK